MANPKTDEEWNQIRFQNSLGPQIGGLIHDAVALTIAIINKASLEGLTKDTDKKVEEINNLIKGWLDTLYEIAENKKAELTEVKPIDIKKAEKQGKDWKVNMAKHEMNEVNRNIQKGTPLSGKYMPGYTKESKQEEVNSELQKEVEDKKREAQDKLNFQQ